jgi:cell division protein FtsB
MATGGDEGLLSRILVLERCMQGWERESKSLEGQNKSLERQIKNLESQIKDLEGQIKDLEGQIKDLKGQIKDLDGENKSLEGQIKDLEDQIKTLEDWQMYRETCAESDSLIWGTPFLLGTVAELFQWCLRRQPSAKSLSNLFWKRRWSSAVRRASTYLRMSPPDFARFADSCIDERNANAAHFQTIDGLVDAIQHCRDLLTRYPSLQAQFPKQTLAINNFELLRAVFIF